MFMSVVRLNLRLQMIEKRKPGINELPLIYFALYHNVVDYRSVREKLSNDSCTCAGFAKVIVQLTTKNFLSM